MKTRKTLGSSLLLLFLAACPGAGAAQSASVLLQEGIYAEEIEGDLDAAIKIYEKIVSQAQQTEQAAAMAIYRIGMCRLKKGDTAGAAEQFEQVTKKYPGQKSLVAKARSQIAKIQPASVSTFRAVIDSSTDGEVCFYDFDEEKVFPCPEWLTRDSPMKKVEEWGVKNGIDLVIGEDGHIELADMVAVKVAYGLWDSAGAAEINVALDKGPYETISLSDLSEGHETSFPITYAFETREGGKGMLQILGKKGGNVLIRYKMLDKAAVAAQGKVNVYEYLPAEIIQHIGGAYGSICAKAAAKNLYSNSHIYFVTPDWVLLKAGMGYHLNSTGRAITGRIRLSGTSNPNQTLYDIAGRQMNAEIVPDKVRKNFYHIYWTPSEPLSPWQMFYYGWSVDVSTPLHPAPESGNYSLRMHNKFGNRCIETFFLVVPEGTRLVSKTEDFTVKNTVADFDIYYWSKELPPSTSNTVDVKLAPSFGDAEFGAVETATIYDCDHPKTKGKHSIIDLDKDVTAKLPVEQLDASSKTIARYLADEGVDAYGEFLSREAGLIALGMVVEEKPADAWEDLTGAELLVSMSGRKAGAAETTVLKWNDKGEQPVFAFATREGAMGLLQIVSADEKAQKFEVRYKKVSGAAPGMASASETVSASPRAAANMLPALKGLMLGVAEAIEKGDTDTAVELLDKLIAESNKMVRSMEGTTTESGVSAGIGMLKMLRDALANRQMDKVETLLEVLNQMGPGLEDAVKEQAAKRRKPYGAPTVE
ncbi:MAG: tetratricopeptide repeat protein [Planctomycetota bacterium]|jgi:hypothetical protein